jgi:transcriptional regulator with PAS, ATPase and Fis domain
MPESKINRHLKEIIDSMTEGLMVAAPDGTILMVNKAFEEIMGFSREEIVGRSCAVLSCDACAASRSASKKGWCDLFEQGAAAEEKTALVDALRQAGGNQSRAAALLGVTRVTVWHRMKKHGIDVRKLVTA